MVDGGIRAEQIPGLEAPEQRASSRAQKRGRPARRGRRAEPAATLPVARVIVDVSLPHLDRPFDYLVPVTMADTAVPGCRVRVRFAGQLVDGYLLERVPSSDHGGRLAFLERVVSPEPVLAPEIAALAREIADRYAGTLADVLRLAVPPRRAAVEAESPTTQPTSTEPDDPAGAAGPPGPWTAYPAGPSFLAALAAGRSPRAIWTALPGPGWPEAVAVAVRATLAGGRGALVVAPDGRDVARLDAALTRVLGATAADAGAGAGGDRGSGYRHVALTADLGPTERYRRWLAVRRGAVRAVVGTRAAMFAPVHRLGLVVLWDDGDDLHAEPHAPYPHARELLALRSHRTGAGALIGGFTRTVEATQLIAGGWARPLAADRATVRRVAPRVRAAGDDAELARDEVARSARLPHEAFRVARLGLRHGPVLVQVPRRGYLPAIGCARCRGPARCAECAGPLAMGSARASPHCRWCGRSAAAWRCPECGGDRVRAAVVGARRTAEELGRAFPSVPVRTSGRDGVLDRVGPEPALVVATPGAEPVADGGYAAALLLDGWALLGRADLRAAEEALRRWMNAAGLVRTGTAEIVGAPDVGEVPGGASLRGAADTARAGGHALAGTANAGTGGAGNAGAGAADVGAANVGAAGAGTAGAGTAGAGTAGAGPAGPGTVVVLADRALPAVQALLRWDPVTLAERELAERADVGFPPAVRMASLTGGATALRELLDTLDTPQGAMVLGPVPFDGADSGGADGADAGGRQRALIRVPRADARALAHALKAAQGARSARKVAETVRVQIDPLELV